MTRRRLILVGLALAILVAVASPFAVYWGYKTVLRRSILADSADARLTHPAVRPERSTECKQEPIEPTTAPALGSLLPDLASADWPTAVQAKGALEALGVKAIPSLVRMLDDDKLVKLRNTADLIYPGAERFYGHGRWLPCDLDWLSARAGWVLEEITFERFGFRDPELLALREDEQQRAHRRAQAVRRAKQWWKRSAGAWNRFDGLIAALRSTDQMRQARAISWLRYGATRCDGLNKETYERVIRPLVEPLVASEDREVRLQAGLLLEDSSRSGWRLFCSNCGRDVTGNQTGRCAECGAQVGRRPWRP